MEEINIKLDDLKKFIKNKNENESEVSDIEHLFQTVFNFNEQSNPDYYNIIFKKIFKYSKNKNQTIKATINELKLLFDKSLKFFEKTEHSEFQTVISNVNKIIAWPIFNDEDFKNKTYLDYDIDIDSLTDYLYESYQNHGNMSRELKSFEFDKKKLKLKIVEYDLEGGISHVYKKGKLFKIIFADGSEMKVK